MDKIPLIPLKADQIPTPLDEATLVKLVQSFLILTNYVALQYQRCATVE